jgi:hypothetical protein
VQTYGVINVSNTPSEKDVHWNVQTTCSLNFYCPPWRWRLVDTPKRRINFCQNTRCHISAAVVTFTAVSTSELPFCWRSHLANIYSAFHTHTHTHTHTHISWILLSVSRQFHSLFQSQFSRVRSRASSFNFQYRLFSLRSTSSCLRLRPHFPVTSILPSILNTCVPWRQSSALPCNLLHVSPACWKLSYVRVIYIYIYMSLNCFNSPSRGTARTLPNFLYCSQILCCAQICVLCIVCFVSFCVLFVCKCVLYYCHRVETHLQLTNISYHISNKRPKRKALEGGGDVGRISVMKDEDTEEMIPHWTSTIFPLVVCYTVQLINTNIKLGRRTKLIRMTSQPVWHPFQT